MNRKDTYFEKERYFDWTEDFTAETAEILALWMSSFVSPTREAGIAFIKSVSIKNEEFKEQFPKINAAYLERYISKESGDKIKKILNSGKLNDQAFQKASNEAVIQAVDVALKEKSNEEIRKICVESVLKRTDTQAVFNIIARCDRGIPKSIKNYRFHDDVRKNATNYERIKRGCGECNRIRNKVQGHKTKEKVEVFLRENLLKDLATLNKCMDLCKGRDEIVQKAKAVQADINGVIEKLDLEPLTLGAMQEMVDGFDVEFILKDARTNHDYDSDAKTLYWHTLEEVRNIVAERNNDMYGAAAELSARLDALEARNNELQVGYDKASAFRSRIVDSFSNIIMAINEENRQNGKAPIPFAGSVQNQGNVNNTPTQESSTQAASITGAMPNMCKYEGGALSSSQMDELVANTIIMADADFWINKESSDYLLRTLNKSLKKHSRKIIVDWSTRVEIFEIEKNATGIFSPEEVRASKTAHEKMSAMHRYGYVRYLGRDEKVMSSRKNIMRIMEENPSIPFTIFTSSKNFCSTMMDNKIGNAIPVYVLPNIAGDDKPERIRPSALPLLKTCLGLEINETPAGTESLEVKSKGESRKQDAEEEIIIVSENEPKDKIESELSKIIIPQSQSVEGDVLTNQKGKSVTLGKEIARGGEGTVFRTNSESVVAKIYHADKVDVDKARKIAYMCEHNPHISQLCWPEGVLYNADGAFVGYTMQNASHYVEFGKSVLKLNSPRVREKTMQGWNRKSLVKLCGSICRVFSKMHEKGIFMGDVNPRNMMVDTTTHSAPKFVFVDCDSFQIGGYPCPVGTKPFTSPKIYKNANVDPKEFKFGTYMRTIEDENYAIAALLFNILMLNQSPFAGKGTTNIDEAMMNYNFAYRTGDGDNTGVDTPDGPYRLIWNNTPPYVKKAFTRVFRDAKEVNVREWTSYLASYLDEMERGNRTDELTPVLYWDYKDPAKRITVDFTCDACGAKRNLHKEAYEKNKSYHLCNDCKSASFRLRDDPEKVSVVCSKCGKGYMVNKWDAWLIENGYKKSICQTCNSVITIKCEGCGSSFTTKQFLASRKYCDECSKPVSVPCGRCGRSHDVKRGTLKMLERAGKTSWCSACKEEVSSRRR